MAEWEKEGKMEIQKLEYLKNQKTFLDEIKSTFHNYLSVTFGEKMRISGHSLQQTTVFVLYLTIIFIYISEAENATLNIVQL